MNLPPGPTIFVSSGGRGGLFRGGFFDFEMDDTEYFERMAAARHDRDRRRHQREEENARVKEQRRQNWESGRAQRPAKNHSKNVRKHLRKDMLDAVRSMCSYGVVHNELGLAAGALVVY